MSDKVWYYAGAILLIICLRGFVEAVVTQGGWLVPGLYGGGILIALNMMQEDA